MRSMRKHFGAALYRVMGGTGAAVGVAAGPGADADVRRANRFWFGTLVFVVLLTFGLLIIRGNALAVQVILAALWGLFIGGTLLFYLPKHLIITLFGALLGGSAAKAGSVSAGVRNFAHVAKELTEVLNQAFSPPPQIYNGSVFVFLLLVALSCLPAYSEK